MKTIVQILKNETAFILIILAMAWGFIIGIIVEKKFERDKILDMQNECVKRKVADFYYMENGKVGFSWRKY